MNIYIYIAVMAVTTYLIRMVPLVLLKKDIKNKYFRAFLKYIPVCCLTAMTVPAIFYATNSIISGIAAFLVAVLLALFKRDLVTVAAGSCIAVFITEQILRLF
ncbi:MAG: AzlD domain-containing protein [Clostridia bacterium]|nr:AzlD domain-containing protein [Clostridia bacterium]